MRNPAARLIFGKYHLDAGLVQNPHKRMPLSAGNELDGAAEKNAALVVLFGCLIVLKTSRNDSGAIGGRLRYSDNPDRNMGMCLDKPLLHKGLLRNDAARSIW